MLPQGLCSSLQFVWDPDSNECFPSVEEISLQKDCVASGGLWSSAGTSPGSCYKTLSEITSQTVCTGLLPTPGVWNGQTCVAAATGSAVPTTTVTSTVTSTVAKTTTSTATSSTTNTSTNTTTATYQCYTGYRSGPGHVPTTWTLFAEANGQPIITSACGCFDMDACNGGLGGGGENDCFKWSQSASASASVWPSNCPKLP